MTTVIEGEEYLTREEIDKRLDTYIEKSADELVLGLRKKKRIKSSKKIEINELAYV